MSVTPRHHARELALQALYAVEMGAEPPDDDFANIVEGEEKPAKASIEYATGLFKLAQTHSEWADGEISRLAENWVLERIACIDRNILKLAMIELEHLPDVPIKVVLNEAIELAKKFSTPESSKFVNGILDSFVKGMEERQGSV